MLKTYDKQWYYRKTLDKKTFRLPIYDLVIWTLYAVIIGALTTSPFFQNILLIILFIVAMVQNQIRTKYTRAECQKLNVLKVLESFLYLMLTIILMLFTFDNAFGFMNLGATTFLSLLFLFLYFGQWVQILFAVTFRLTDFFKKEDGDDTLPWDQNTSHNQSKSNLYIDKDIKVENLDQSRMNLLNLSNLGNFYKVKKY